MPVGRSFMNWGEVRELFASDLVSFGSHTIHHARLTTLPAAAVAVELQGAMEKLYTEKIAKKRISFCYPNGNYSTEITKLVAQSGYSSAMTCDSGWNKVGDDLFSLRRISLHQDISFSDALLSYRLAQFQ